MKTHLPLTIILPLAVSGVGMAQSGPPIMKTLAPAKMSEALREPPKPEIPFVPFKIDDLYKPDSTGAKVHIKTGEMITLKNGKTVSVDDYVKSTNALEKILNKYGYSLRTGTVVPQPAANSTKLQKGQSDLNSLITPANANQPTVTLDGVPYEEAMASLEAPSDSTSSMDRLAFGAGVRDSNSGKGSAAKVAFRKMNVSGGKSFQWGSTTDDFGAYFKCALYLDGSYDATDQKFAKSLSEFNAKASADAGVVLFGQNLDLLHGDTSYQGSDKGGTVRLAANIGICGVTVWQEDTTQSIGYSDSHLWQQDFDESIPSVDIPCGPISVSMAAGVQGRVGAELDYTLFTSHVKGYLAPFLVSVAYFKAGASIGIPDIASVDAGIDGNLTLLALNLKLSSDAGITYENGFHFKDSFKIEDNMSALNGNISLYAGWSVGPSFLGISDNYSHNLFSWSGITQNATLFDVHQDLALPWH